MNLDQMAHFFHYKISSGHCADCIVTNLKDTPFCKDLGNNCIENIKKFLTSERIEDSV